MNVFLKKFEKLDVSIQQSWDITCDKQAGLQLKQLQPTYKTSKRCHHRNLLS